MMGTAGCAGEPAGGTTPDGGGTELVDVHAHFLTDAYLAAATAAGHRTPDGMPAWPRWDVDSHLALMDASGIATSILSISSPGVHFGAAGGGDEPARRLARQVNEFAAGVVAAHPTRFGQFAALPLPDVAGAVAEAVYALDELGANGVVVLSHAGGVYPADPVLDPLLEELNRRAAVVLVHPTSPPHWEAVARGRPRPLMEFLFDGARAAVDLALSDRLTRFPDIHWVFTHGGGVLPLLADRIDLFLAHVGGGAPRSRDLLSRFWYDSAGTPFPLQLPALAAVVGTERLLYGSDFCFTPPAAVAAQLASLDAAPAPEGAVSWRDLLARNAGRLARSE